MANIRLGKELAGMKSKLEAIYALNNCNSDEYTVEIGLSTDKDFRTPASAINNPIAVCDSMNIGDSLFESEQDKADFDKDAKAFRFKQVYNAQTGRFDTRFFREGTNDSLIESQAIAPWNASYFPQMFRQPLISTHGLDMVDRYAGDNPFAEVMNLMLGSYTGNAITEQAGTMSANLNHNVAVKAGMMTQQLST